jgi:hypothetical protein
LSELSNLKSLVEREIARREAAEIQTVVIDRIIVEPIMVSEERVGSRVWYDGVELEEGDERFRKAVTGGRDMTEDDYPDDDLRFRRVVPREAIAEDAIAAVAERIAALRAKQ